MGTFRIKSFKLLKKISENKKLKKKCMNTKCFLLTHFENSMKKRLFIHAFEVGNFFGKNKIVKK